MSRSPPRAARRLMPKDGDFPMLSIPLERLETPPRPSSSVQLGQGYDMLGRRQPSGLLRSRRLAHERVPLRSSLGTHYLFAHVGNPPQRVSLIVDTGSYTLAFPCVGCKNCRVGQRQSFWDPQLSETGFEVGCEECQRPYTCSTRNPRCSFRQSYSEGSSWTAYQMHDVVRLGGKEMPLEEDNEKREEELSAGTNSVNFGCIQQQSGMFDTQVADGIIGLGPHKDSVVWQMAAMGAPDNKKFSICLSHKGGNMVLGGFDPMLLEPGEYHEYTPANFKAGWFSVKVMDISLGDAQIASPEALMAFEKGAGTIVDSGTTDTYLPRMMAPDWQRVWLATARVPFQNCADDAFCMSFTPEEIKNLPVFTITLAGGVTLSLPAEGYMDPGPRIDGGRVSYAPRIYLTEQVGAVLGANLIMNHNVLFDVSNERLGFVKARCDFNDSDKRDRVRERTETNVTVVSPPKPNDFQIFVPVDVPSNVPTNVLGNDPEGVMKGASTVGGSSKANANDDEKGIGVPAGSARGVEASGGAGVYGDKESSGEDGIGEGGGLKGDASGGLGGGREGGSGGGDERESQLRRAFCWGLHVFDGNHGVNGKETEKEQVVDCEFELLEASPCEVECPQGLDVQRIVKGSQNFLVHVTVPAKGAGKPCPEDEVRGDRGAAEMLLKIEACDVVCQPEAILEPAGADGGAGGTGRSEGVLGTGEGDSPDGKEELKGGSQGQERGDEVDKEGKEDADGVGGEIETAQEECSAPMAWLWSRCAKACTQRRFEEDDCNGIREVRYCDTGDLCPAGREGVYADLTFKLHIPELAAAAAGGGAGASRAGEERWRLHVANALAEALATRLANVCRVGPGNIQVTLLSSGSSGEGDSGEGGQHLGGIMAALVSVHMVDPAAATVPASLRFELDDPCITALGGEALASNLTPGVARALIGMAGRLPGAVELADLIKVVEAGRLALRSATSGVPIIDNAASDGVGAGSKTLRPAEYHHPMEVDRKRPSGSLGLLPSPSTPPSSPSSTFIFVTQAAVIVAIIGVLLLMKWWRAISQGGRGLGGERMVAADMRRRHEVRARSWSADGREVDEEAGRYSRGHQRRNSASRFNGEKDRTC